MVNSVQRNNEVVGQKTNASVAKSVLVRAFDDIKEGVRNFLNVKDGQVWHQIPARESQAKALELLHAA